VVVLVAVGALGGFVAQSGLPKVARRQTTNMTQIPANWIGQQVVTKYGAPVLAENQSSHRPGVRTVYTVTEIDGDRARLASESGNGWIESSKIIHFNQAIEFYTKELVANPNKALVRFERGVVWTQLGKADEAIVDLADAIRLDAGQAYSSAKSPAVSTST
jgi:tetratricopeptide (TPR) repeat protein